MPPRSPNSNFFVNPKMIYDVIDQENGKRLRFRGFVYEWEENKGRVRTNKRILDLASDSKTDDISIRRNKCPKSRVPELYREMQFYVVATSSGLEAVEAVFTDPALYHYPRTWDSGRGPVLKNGNIPDKPSPPMLEPRRRRLLNNAITSSDHPAFPPQSRFSPPGPSKRQNNNSHPNNNHPPHANHQRRDVQGRPIFNSAKTWNSSNPLGQNNHSNNTNHPLKNGAEHTALPTEKNSEPVSNPTDANPPKKSDDDIKNETGNMHTSSVETSEDNEKLEEQDSAYVIDGIDDLETDGIDDLDSLQNSDLVSSDLKPAFSFTSKSMAFGAVHKENEEQRSRACPICRRYEVNVALSPCGHLGCSLCFTFCEDCPICGKVVQNELPLRIWGSFNPPKKLKDSDEAPKPPPKQRSYDSK